MLSAVFLVIEDDKIRDAGYFRDRDTHICWTNIIRMNKRV